ncbi:MAG: type II toxin-antitoxin system ParD family antitoxin [Candidatus Devosia phytovorans]|uniref:Type II toxin-antitoxin system ParD family antitoxin n=1 Tax=Candidatus Devosia phytovorans TaxID=3121372 RepID=A0AAJ5VWH8_9HYPH|nr:type II toxin-antitoxin system ParD family antitoxin [Devosia sp.]WEK04772.1 MAG: type II toxin-antitoxin system ParD family antitoxin [Devosia sp.]
MPSSYSLGDHYEAFAKNLVASGRYASVSEVLRDGMRLMEEREALREWKLNELKKAIQDGIDSGDAGPMDAEEIKREGRRILAERAKSNAA